MSRAVTVGMGLLVAVGALGLGFYFGRVNLLAPTSLTEQVLTSSQFTDLKGESTTIERWKGQWRVVNFWATWCAPCREEMPAFAAVSRRFADKNTVIVGIGIDSRQKVAAFAKELNIDYPLLTSDAAGIEIMRSLGKHVRSATFHDYRRSCG